MRAVPNSNQLRLVGIASTALTFTLLSVLRTYHIEPSKHLVAFACAFAALQALRGLIFTRRYDSLPELPAQDIDNDEDADTNTFWVDSDEELSGHSRSEVSRPLSTLWLLDWSRDAVKQ